MNDSERNPRRFWITLGVGAVLGVGIALLRGMGGDKTLAQNAGYLSDGWFVVGVMLAGVGALLAISGKTDFFDMLSYGFKSLVVMFTPFKKPEDHPKFYEYKMMRKENRRPPKLFLLFAGLVLIGLAAGCLLFGSY